MSHLWSPACRISLILDLWGSEPVKKNEQAWLVQNTCHDRDWFSHRLVWGSSSPQKCCCCLCFLIQLDSILDQQRFWTWLKIFEAEFMELCANMGPKVRSSFGWFKKRQILMVRAVVCVSSLCTRQMRKKSIQPTNFDRWVCVFIGDKMVMINANPMPLVHSILYLDVALLGALDLHRLLPSYHL